MAKERGATKEERKKQKKSATYLRKGSKRKEYKLNVIVQKLRDTTIYFRRKIWEEGHDDGAHKK